MHFTLSLHLSAEIHWPKCSLTPRWKGNFVATCLIIIMVNIITAGTWDRVPDTTGSLLFLQLKRKGFFHHCLSHVVTCWEIWLPWNFNNYLSSLPAFSQLFSLPLGVLLQGYVTLVSDTFTYPGTLWALSLIWCHLRSFTTKSSDS